MDYKGEIINAKDKYTKHIWKREMKPLFSKYEQDCEINPWYLFHSIFIYCILYIQQIYKEEVVQQENLFQLTTSLTSSSCGKTCRYLEMIIKAYL